MSKKYWIGKEGLIEIIKYPMQPRTTSIRNPLLLVLSDTDSKCWFGMSILEIFEGSKNESEAHPPDPVKESTQPKW